MPAESARRLPGLSRLGPRRGGLGLVGGDVIAMFEAVVIAVAMTASGTMRHGAGELYESTGLNRCPAARLRTFHRVRRPRTVGEHGHEGHRRTVARVGDAHRPARVDGRCGTRLSGVGSSWRSRESSGKTPSGPVPAPRTGSTTICSRAGHDRIIGWHPAPSVRGRWNGGTTLPETALRRRCRSCRDPRDR